MLALGVGLVQISSSSSGKTEGGDESGDGAKGGDDLQNPVLGLVFVLMACCTSGFAGVYFEMVGAFMAMVERSK